MSTIVQEPPVETPVESPSVLDEETRRVLQDARRLLVEKGWMQGDMRDDLGRMCVLGALCEAMGSRPIPSFDADPEVVLVRALGQDPLRTRIASWNDDPSRTKAEVIDLFDRVLAA